MAVSDLDTEIASLERELDTLRAARQVLSKRGAVPAKPAGPPETAADPVPSKPKPEAKPKPVPPLPPIPAEEDNPILPMSKVAQEAPDLAGFVLRASMKPPKRGGRPANSDIARCVASALHDNGPRTTGGLSLALGISHSLIEATLKLDAKSFEKAGGKWSLTAAGRQAVHGS